MSRNSIKPGDGRDLIADERLRQKTVEGYTDEHDDKHDRGELGNAADCYRLLGLGSYGLSGPEANQSGASEPHDWPWDYRWWKPKTRLQNLVRAGALYQAEIDRLCRVRSAVAEEIDRFISPTTE